LTDKDQGQVAY